MKIERPKPIQPTPGHAKKVFEGTIFDTYQWEQELFDGSTATFEKVKRPDTANVIPVTDEGKLIITEQEQPGERPFIGTLGGRIDDGETPLDAAKRELLEESGYEAEKFTLWYSIQPLAKIDWAIYTFIAKGLSKNQGAQPDAGEKIKLKYLTFDEFIDLAARENFRDGEIALKIFQSMNNPKNFAEMKKLFLED